jgi:tRNA A37 methylthiotransferase MiaB
MIDVFLSFTKEIALQKNQTLGGRVEEILVEGQSKQSTQDMTGRTQSDNVIN